MLLELKNVDYKYSEGSAFEAAALSDVNIGIEEGEFIAVIGHTGSGKSTLIQTMNALIKPTSGQVLFNGEDINADKYDRRKLRTQVGLVFQYPENQLFESDVISDVCFGPKNQGLSEEEARERAKAALKRVQISEDLFGCSPFELSGGQKRRVAIAGILAMEPKILILDEPTAGLDPMGRDYILDEAKRLQTEKNVTVILVSHSMEDVAKYASRVIVMSGGRVVTDGKPKEVFSKSDELEKINLSAPQVTYVMKELLKRGFDVDINAITVEEAKESIIKSIERRRNA
ncbi:MAG: energy-coupling factor transporter ATPase [Lachnospiraceae bacterium]|jgi:energy-coupling factor transport system ATP-binding protein